MEEDDAQQKASGIANLGALLDRSERMIALVSEDYFDRMWCVFEFAAFTRRAGATRVDLIPLHVPLLPLQTAQLPAAVGRTSAAATALQAKARAKKAKEVGSHTRDFGSVRRYSSGPP